MLPHGYGLKVVTPPDVEPVSFSDMQAQLRDLTTFEQTLVESDIKVAREYYETFTGRVFITQSLEQTIPCFPCGRTIDLCCPPVQAVNSITYTDIAGNQQTLSSSLYTLNTYGVRAQIVLNYGEIWPQTRNEPTSIKINYDAGYGDAASDVPEGLKKAIKLRAADLYEVREDSETPAGYKRSSDQLAWPYRVLEG